MTEEELDAAVDVIAAVDAGVLQSLNQRIKQRSKTVNPRGPHGDQDAGTLSTSGYTPQCLILSPLMPVLAGRRAGLQPNGSIVVYNAQP